MKTLTDQLFFMNSLTYSREYFFSNLRMRIPTLSVSAHVAGQSAASSTFNRDEVFDVKVSTSDTTFTGDMIIELSSGDKTENLNYGTISDRSSIQIYDFADYSTLSSLSTTETHKYKLSFVASDNGVKKFKVIINKNQSVKIKASYTKDSTTISGETSSITIEKTVRKYCTISGYGLANANNKDTELETVPTDANWTDTSWKFNSFTFPSVTSAATS